MIPLWGYAAGGLLIAAAGFGSGWTVRTWKADSDALKTYQAGIKRGKEQQQLADHKAGLYEEQRHDAQVVTQGRDTEIRTIYRNVVVDAKCEPPADALSVLDAAIASTTAQVAGQLGAAVPAPAPEADPVR